MGATSLGTEKDISFTPNTAIEHNNILSPSHVKRKGRPRGLRMQSTVEKVCKKKKCKAARNKACRDGTSVHDSDLGTSTKHPTHEEIHGRDTNNMVSFIVISRFAKLYKVINYFKLCVCQVCDV